MTDQDTWVEAADVPQERERRKHTHARRNARGCVLPFAEQLYRFPGGVKGEGGGGIVREMAGRRPKAVPSPRLPNPNRKITESRA